MLCWSLELLVVLGDGWLISCVGKDFLFEY
uniref:Uncharacterized protein n=1 Tax=Arundo donax TaxID=35708 RepID=A0A0A9G196_ARUDO